MTEPQSLCGSMPHLRAAAKGHCPVPFTCKQPRQRSQQRLLPGAAAQAFTAATPRRSGRPQHWRSTACHEQRVALLHLLGRGQLALGGLQGEPARK